MRAILAGMNPVELAAALWAVVTVAFTAGWMISARVADRRALGILAYWRGARVRPVPDPRRALCRECQRVVDLDDADHAELRHTIADVIEEPAADDGTPPAFVPELPQPLDATEPSLPAGEYGTRVDIGLPAQPGELPPAVAVRKAGSLKQWV